MAKSDFRPSDISSKPGVYVFRDQFGSIIYVGKAANLRRRVSQYFQPSRTMRADAKLRSLISSIDSWETFPVNNEDESLILESRFIKEYAPRYNILMRDDKRYLLLKIDLSEKFPRLRPTRLKRKDNALYFGPFPHGNAMRELAIWLTKHCGLRSCNCSDPGEEHRKHCLAGNVKDCCQPCIGVASPEEYQERLNKAIDILNGNISETEELLTNQMKEAAAAQKFEKASSFRDMLSNLREVCGIKRRTFENASIPSVVGHTAVEDLKETLKLPSLPTVIECFDISNIGGTLAVASLVRFRDGKPEKSGYRRFRIRTVEGANDFAMMYEAVTRYFSRLMNFDLPRPDLLMVDGGKGQLSSALRALVELDVPPFPVIGLAERNEEIYLPGRSEPLVLDRHKPALRVLQAVRDEAHRFAISYHRELRMKRLEESVLDGIEGLGKVRKALLLKEFGSVAVLRKTSAEEIARRVSGVGIVFARTIVDYLKNH